MSKERDIIEAYGSSGRAQCRLEYSHFSHDICDEPLLIGAGGFPITTMSLNWTVAPAPIAVAKLIFCPNWNISIFAYSPRSVLIAARCGSTVKSAPWSDEGVVASAPVNYLRKLPKNDCRFPSSRPRSESEKRVVGSGRTERPEGTEEHVAEARRIWTCFNARTDLKLRAAQYTEPPRSNGLRAFRCLRQVTAHVHAPGICTESGAPTHTTVLLEPTTASAPMTVGVIEIVCADVGIRADIVMLLPALLPSRRTSVENIVCCRWC